MAKFNNIYDDVIDAMEEVLTEKLPHGSGIDCKWAFKYLDNGKIKCSNSWHVMNDVGFYMGYVDFSVTLGSDDFTLQFHTNSAGRYWVNKLDLRTYLQDTFYQMLYCD